MKKFPLDLSKFKKIKDEKDHTILRHPEGHEIKIAKGKLDPKMRGQLAELPMQDADKKQPKGNPKLEESKKEPVKMADGGEIPINVDKALELPANASQQAADPSIFDVLPTSAASQALAAAESAKTPDSSVISYPQDTVRAPAAAPIAEQQPAAAPSLAPAQAPAAAAPQQPTVDLNAQKSLIDQAYQNQMSGIQGLGQAQSQEAQLKHESLQQGIDAQQQALKTFQDSAAKINNHIDTIAHDIEQGHIDPKRLISNMSTGQKIATGIGLFLGGIGQGLKGGDNPALEFLNKQIDRDIDAQKAEMSKKENLVSIYSKEFGNLKDGADMARIILNQTLQNQMLDAAAKSGSKAAMANAQIGVGKLQQEIAPVKLSMSLNQALIQASQQDAANGGGTGAQERMLPILRQIAPDKAKEIETRLVPGVGIAETPVSAENRDKILAKQQLDKELRDLYTWSKQHSGSVDPSVVNYGKTKAAEIQSMYRNAINGGVFKKGEQEFIDNIIDSDPTKFFNSFRVAPKIQAVLDSNSQQLNSLKRSVGLPHTTDEMAKLTPQQQSFLKWAKENPKDPRAALVLKKLGR